MHEACEQNTKDGSDGGGVDVGKVCLKKRKTIVQLCLTQMSGRGRWEAQVEAVLSEEEMGIGEEGLVLDAWAQRLSTWVTDFSGCP